MPATLVWRNSEDGYGFVAIILHWLMAAAIVGLFWLGLWMVDLTYYDPWYRQAPYVHKGIGILLFLTLLARLTWKWINSRPRPEPGLSTFERRTSSAVHVALYILLLAVMLSGYLISTADGRPIPVFEIFQVPASITGIPKQADLAGKVHLALAVFLIVFAGVHAVGALKHHFIDRDRTLIRMIFPSRCRKPPDRQTERP